MFISLIGLCILVIGIMLFMITQMAMCDTGLWLPSIMCIIGGLVLLILTAFAPEMIPDALMDEYYLYNLRFAVVAP